MPAIRSSRVQGDIETRIAEWCTNGYVSFDFEQHAGECLLAEYFTLVPPLLIAPCPFRIHLRVQKPPQILAGLSADKKKRELKAITANSAIEVSTV